MPFGYTGSILHIDLTNKKFNIENPPEAFYRLYMGGSAMGLYYLLKLMPPGIDPLSPECVLTLFASATTGAPISGLSRLNANAKSPISGAIGDSQSGGFFPAELKFAGFDGIVIKGRSENPVYLSIFYGQPCFHDASRLIGKTTAEVEEILKLETGEKNAEVLQHGPAAENGVLFSSLVTMASRNNGRTGMGLVMASKNLRAIVVRGKSKLSLANPAALTRLNRIGAKGLSSNPDMDGLTKHGTASVVSFQNTMGSLPTRNYSEGQFEYADDICGERLTETILRESKTCFACFVKCKRVVETQTEHYSVDPMYGGPEYETISAFGSYCGIRDLSAISRANQICNAYGVDTITAGATIAFAIECFENGIIGSSQTGGMELRFGDPAVMLEVLQQIVRNEGSLGEILSQGSARAAKKWGPEAEALLTCVKNQEAPAHMPQAKKSLGLIYAVNPFGADHQSSEHDWMYEKTVTSDLYLSRLSELGLINPCEPGSLDAEKVRFAVLTQQFYSMLDSLELCQFVWGPAWTLYSPSEIVEMVHAVTGWKTSIDELLQLGRRRLNLMRVFNAREGFSRQQDALPAKFFKPLLGQGPTAGVSMDKKEFESALDFYYSLNGWTVEGIPTIENLSELGVEWAGEYLL